MRLMLVRTCIIPAAFLTFCLETAGTPCNLGCACFCVSTTFIVLLLPLLISYGSGLLLS
jgi:hypothetical protein